MPEAQESSSIPRVSHKVQYETKENLILKLSDQETKYP